MKHFWQIVDNAVDWTSVKISSFTILGIFSGLTWLQWLSVVGIASTIIYNDIRIYKELKKK